MHLARAGAGWVGRPAWRARFSHQSIQRLCFTVEDGARLLAAQHNALERVREHLLELARAVAEAGRYQSRQGVLCRLHVFHRRGSDLHPRLISDGQATSRPGKSQRCGPPQSELWAGLNSRLPPARRSYRMGSLIRRDQRAPACARDPWVPRGRGTATNSSGFVAERVAYPGRCGRSRSRTSPDSSGCCMKL